MLGLFWYMVNLHVDQSNPFMTLLEVLVWRIRLVFHLGLLQPYLFVCLFLGLYQLCTRYTGDTGIEPGLAVCKSGAPPTMLLSWPLSHISKIEPLNSYCSMSWNTLLSNYQIVYKCLMYMVERSHHMDAQVGPHPSLRVFPKAPFPFQILLANLRLPDSSWEVLGGGCTAGLTSFVFLLSGFSPTAPHYQCPKTVSLIGCSFAVIYDRRTNLVAAVLLWKLPVGVL